MPQEVHNFRQLNFHLKVVHPKILLSCDKCKKKFKSKQTLRRHQLRAHGDVGEFPCSYENCKSLFLTTFDLDRHIKYYHERSYLCVYCGLAFHRKKDKERHDARYHPQGDETNCVGVR